ncbi:hypothetical protein A2714_05460 [Candidatus Woesebacteria bacterium RIFCSPHIGHO2_01_FULL_38_9]|uniref:Uncharacterized protein n=2 Tax=Candidatus Woeseibacteriota TaxID=1752722 RepID=A0A1F7Y3V0_9BACT|nr:MAG: hypothetical protein A2714_05460 [Candidatus Woesebacteria bacterium RIFCSPHIGHO2_01_FULL_38_9]OGM60918.1 MAG: hypothetical protein A3A75_02405 [Candidatus Woesebacteria bacterium RIFCSPLOWO2_01_FULL_39_10]
MLTQVLEKVDKFYIVLVVTLFLLAAVEIFAFRGVFGAYLTAYEFDQEDLGNEVRVDREVLQEAHSWAFNKQTQPLEIR